MDVRTTWTDKMMFTGQADNQTVTMDAKAPIGSGQGMTPKEMAAVGLCGCTAMDVIALMKKHKQPVEYFDVSAHIDMTSEGHPVIFKTVELTFTVKGSIDKEKLLEAVHLSQSKYCGVSAMIAKAAPIHYKVILNDEEIGAGSAEFQ